MRILFLADAHLRQPADSNYRLMLRFLEQLPKDVTTLCILGDLFDFRIGLPALDFPEQEPVLAALSRIRQQGVRLIYLEGNHDFHLGPEFVRQTGAELFTGPTTLELQGKQIRLCHGDLVNSSDWRYRLLYLLIRNRGALLAGHMIPPVVVRGIRRRLQHSSRSRYEYDRSRWNYQAIIRDYAAAIRQQGYDALVLGHFHLPFIDIEPGFTLLSLGDWIGQFSYGQYVNGLFSLHAFSDAV